MTAFVKVGGAWKPLTPHVKVSGSWRTLAGGWVKVAGVWRKFHPSTVPLEVVLLGSVFNTSTGTKSLSGLPVQIGDWIIVLAASTGNTLFTVSDSAAVPAYNEYGRALKASSADAMAWFARTSLIASAEALTVTCDQSSSTGGGIAVFAVRGSAGVVRSAGAVNNVAAGTNPAPVLSSAPLSTSAILGGWFNGAQVGISPRAGYTEQFDLTYGTPAAQFEAMVRVGGETSQTIAWGGAPGTGIHCASAIELSV